MEGWGGARRHLPLPSYPNQLQGFVTDHDTGGWHVSLHLSLGHDTYRWAHLEGTFGGTDLQNGTSQATLPLRGELPSPEHPNGGMPRSPFPAAVWDTDSPSLCSGSLGWPRRGRGHVRG